MQVSRKGTMFAIFEQQNEADGREEGEEVGGNEICAPVGPWTMWGLIARVRTWDFAVTTKGSTAGCCGWNKVATWIFLNLLPEPSSVLPQGLYPGCAFCQNDFPSLSAESYFLIP